MQIQDLQGLADSNQSAAIYPSTSQSTILQVEKLQPEISCIQQDFEWQVQQTPDAIALIAGKQSLTYQALNQQVNQLANYLRNIGIQANDLIAISMNPAIEMIVAVLGVLKAGGAYLPIDPSYPSERILYKLQDAQPKLILTQSPIAETLPSTANIPYICLDQDWSIMTQFSTENLPIISKADALAYIIYTSGTTGRPKGVMISQSSMVHHSRTIAQYFHLQPGDRVLQFCSLSFDIFIEEVFPTLISGATIVLRVDNQITRISQFLKFIDQQQISVLNLPTAFWHELANNLIERQQKTLFNVRLLIVGGEKVSASMYWAWRNLIGDFPRWLNAYGPTETTVTATIFDPSQACYFVDGNELPIGRSIGDTKTYVLDAQLHLLPINEIGELYISGPGVAIGYLNRPDLSAAKFIANPHANSTDHARLYKTGDLARYLPDGNIEFLGRVDDQVKIRGFRIELGEIEAVLERSPIVQQAIVTTREDIANQKSLVAYVILNHQMGQHSVLHSVQQQIRHLYEQLQEQLPEYMRPNTIVPLEKLPLLPNGKIDRRALPSPQSCQISKSSPPQDDYEFHLLQIWQKALNMPNPGRQENFFALGGNSLLVAQLADQIEQRFGQSLSLTTLFQTPTIAAQAAILREQSSQLPEQILVPLRTISPLSSAQLETKPGLFLCEGIFFYYPIVPYLSLDQPVYGLSVPDRYDAQGQPKSLTAMAAECVQAIRAQQPEGPYLLGGGSFGGTVAYEVAQQLQAQGQTVSLVVLFDTILPHAYQPLALPQWLWFQLQKIIRSPRLLKQKLLGRYDQLHHYWLSQIAVRTSTKSSKNHLDRMARLELNDQIERAYIPTPYSGKVIIFQASIRDEAVQIAADMGWGELVKDLEFYPVSGNHITILQEPNVAVIGQQIQDCIQSCLQR